MAIKDDKTPRLGLLLPFTDNFLQDDVERLRDTFGLLDVLVVTRDETTGKIADDMLSSVIAKLDAQGKLLTAQIPGSVVQKGPDGKIDASLMPSIAVVDTFPVPNEASMLGLQCERGDIAIREDLGKTFILTQMPPSVLSNWRELTSTNVTSVNGKTGAITGLAGSGANKDITSLEALSGPLRLGGDGAGDYDAVTMKQLRAASGGAGGASMNGVMNNFIGAVEWFNGSRAKLPAGYVAADGQTLNRVDWPDLWAAVSGSVLNSVTEALWNTLSSAGNPRGQFYYNRGSYSQGDGNLTTGTTFRVPDLNGGQAGAGSIPNTFLNGSAPSLSANVGTLRESAAPPIKGDMYDRATLNAQGTVVSNNISTTGAYQVTVPDASATIAYQLTSTSPTKTERINFDASRSDTLYSGQANELRPNTAVGIWIIRASGLFSAQGTEFSVIRADTTMPAVNTYVEGGYFTSNYQVAGKTKVTSSIRAGHRIGEPFGAIRFSVELKNDDGTSVSPTPVQSEMYLRTDGKLTLNGSPVNVASASGWGTLTQTDGPAATNSLTMVSGMYYAMGSAIGQPGGLTTQGFGLLQFTGNNPGYRCQLATQDGNSGRLFIRASTILAGQSNPSWSASGWQEFQKVSTSDERLKNSIKDGDTSVALNNIDQMEFKTFAYNNDIQARIRRGLIAQDLEKIDPNYLEDRDDEGEFRVLNIQTLLMDSLAAIQALSRRVKDLEAAAK